MTRLENMEFYLKPFIAERISEKINLVDKLEDKILKVKIADILEKARLKQQNNSWIPSCLGIFHLRSSILTKSFKYVIVLSNELLYFDYDLLQIDWIPQLIYCNLDIERRLMVDKLNCKFVRISEYEIEYLLNQIFLEFKALTEVYVLKTLNQILIEDIFTGIIKKEPFDFIFGDYMGEIKLILKTKKGIVYGE